ncbi:MAG: tripartite tricarboxylate transporter substrate binding protein [Pseudomonadota bacterium]
MQTTKIPTGATRHTTFTRTIAKAAAALLLLGAAAGAWAQDYPNRVVRITTPFPAGSGVDVNLRLVADKLSKRWGKPVIIENRPGANGFIAIEAAKRARPDGHELLQLDSAQMAAQPFLFKKIPYDLDRDFDPVTTIFRNYFFLAVPTTSPYKNVGELLAAARAQPGGINYGSWFVGSPGHLGASMLDTAAGTTMMHIPFKEMTQLYTAVANQEVSWAFGTIGSMNPLYRAGKLRFLAAAAPRRIARFTDVPTMGEAGGPAGFELSAWVGILAPKGTPKAVRDKIYQDVAAVLKDPEIEERFTQMAYEPIAMTEAQFRGQLKTDAQRYGETIRRLNISLD